MKTSELIEVLDVLNGDQYPDLAYNEAARRAMELVERNAKYGPLP